MKKTRLMSMLCAIAMALTLVLPVGAVSKVSSLAGISLPMAFEIYDANQQRLPSPRVIYEGDNLNLTLPGQGTTYVINGSHSDGYYRLLAGSPGQFTITLESAGFVEFGYLVKGEPVVWEYNAGQGTSFTYDFTVPGQFGSGETVLIKIAIRNRGSMAVIIDAASVTV